MNIVCLTGNLGKDPETRFTQSGMAVCSFSLATTKYAKGEKKTSWHNVVCFSKTAETAQQYLSKGSKCAVVGEISYSDWEKDGVKHYKTDIIANNIEFLDSKSGDTSRAEHAQHPAARADHYTKQGGNQQTGGFDDGSEIPF